MPQILLPQLPPLPADSEFCVISRRNESLDRRGRGPAHELRRTLKLAGEALEIDEALPPGRREAAKALRRLTAAH